MINSASANLNSIHSLTAQIISAEGLEVIFNPDAKTASFNVKERTLVFPVFDHMDNNVFVYFMMHEIGHALFTSEDMLKRGMDLEIAHSLMNIVEDARIERLIQEKYKAICPYFREGSRTLFNDGFFGEIDQIHELAQDMSNAPCSFLDRGNLHFKLGIRGIIRVTFTDEELDLIHILKYIRTEKDTIEVCLKIKEYIEDALKQRLKESLKESSSFEYSPDKKEDSTNGDGLEIPNQQAEEEKKGREDDESSDGEDNENSDGEDDENSDGEYDEKKNDPYSALTNKDLKKEFKNEIDSSPDNSRRKIVTIDLGDPSFQNIIKSITPE